LGGDHFLLRHRFPRDDRQGHELEALRASPRDTDANVWVAYIALSKLHLGAYEDALGVYRHSIELNPNYPTARFYLAAALAKLGRLDEAKTEVKAALALNPRFTGAIERVCKRRQSSFLERARADH
jgi:tetratricopeptide (TPR) repeat protein